MHMMTVLPFSLSLSTQALTDPEGLHDVHAALYHFGQEQREIVIWESSACTCFFDSNETLST